MVHRGLSPYALWVRERPDGGVKVLVGEWRSVGSAGDLATATRGVTVLHAQGIDEEEDQEAVFQAPEGVWSTTANRIRLDLFGLGATAYLVLTGHLPANDRNALLARLRDQSGLDISVDLPAASTELRNPGPSCPSQSSSSALACTGRSWAACRCSWSPAARSWSPAASSPAPAAWFFSFPKGLRSTVRAGPGQ